MTSEEWITLQNTLVMVFSPLIYSWAVLLIAGSIGLVVVTTVAYIVKGARF